MIARVHQRLGTAGFVIAIVALVAALGGGAYAAKGGLTGKQKQEVTKIAQKEAKKFAKKGPAGPPGNNGSNGSPGAPGASGPAGESVTATKFSGNQHGCTEGGVEFEVGGQATFACNGAKGANGTSGANGNTVLNGSGAPTTQGVNGDFYIDTSANEIYGPKAGGTWPATGTSMEGPQGPEGNIKETLPAGTTLKGSWTAGPLNAAGAAEPLFGAISFNIPLSVNVTRVYYMKEGESENPHTTTGVVVECQGGAANPTVVNAVSGSAILCVFAKKEVNWLLPREEGNAFEGIAKSTANKSPAKKAGAILQGESLAAGASYAYGSWALRITP